MSEQTTFQRVIQTAVERRASDIHLGADAKPAIRVQGKIELIPDTKKLSPDDTYAVIEHLFKPETLDIFNAEGEVDSSVNYGETRLRIHAYSDSNGTNIAMRIVAQELPSYDDLNLPPVLQKIVSEYESGLVLIAGPTGSGKTTTRTALLQFINQNKPAHIISLSDTVEYKLKNEKSIIHQRTVGVGGHTKSYDLALASALREDPDVISIGDLREQAAIETALSAAQSGHLVIAEMHAQTTTDALSRLTGHFPSGHRADIQNDLGNALIAVVAQRLIPRIDTNDNSLILATEVLIKNDAIANLIREARFSGILDIIRSRREDGMHTLTDHVNHLAKAKVISPEDASKVATSFS